MQASLVIPCYNEEESISLLAERCIAATQAEPDLDIILVDNGSTDGSPALLTEVARAPGLSYVRVKSNEGYGHGLLTGLAAARGDIVGWTHADLQTDPMDAVTGFRLFKSAGDWGRLYVKGRRQGRPLTDVAFTAGMSAFETLLLARPLFDINAQPNLFPRSLFESWTSAPKDFSLDLFAYHSAKAAGFRVVRFPVAFYAREHGRSHWNVNWRAKVKFIKRTIDFSFELKRGLRGGAG
jgi:glycosyltransferase involved in cell wall biosynthesis